MCLFSISRSSSSNHGHCTCDIEFHLVHEPAILLVGEYKFLELEIMSFNNDMYFLFISRIYREDKDRDRDWYVMSVCTVE